MNLKLKKIENFKGRSGPLLLIIMDGIGINKPGDNNAVYLARTPNLDKLFTLPFFYKIKSSRTCRWIAYGRGYGK